MDSNLLKVFDKTTYLNVSALISHIYKRMVQVRRGLIEWKKIKSCTVCLTPSGEMLKEYLAHVSHIYRIGMVLSCMSADGVKCNEKLILYCVTLPLEQSWRSVQPTSTKVPSFTNADGEEGNDTLNSLLTTICGKVQGTLSDIFLPYTNVWCQACAD